MSYSVFMARKAADKPGLLSRAFTAEVRVELAAQNLTQAQLADRIGKSKGYVSQRLRLEALWSVNDLEDIADAFGMDAFQLTYRALERRRGIASQTVAFSDEYVENMADTFDIEHSRFRRLTERAAAVPPQVLTWDKS